MKMEKLYQDRQIRLTVFWTLLFSLVSQGFRWFNTSFNHDSLIVWQIDGSKQMFLGRYLVPFWLLVRGKIGAPLLIAGFSVCFLILADILLVKLLDIRKPRHIAVLCALLSACPLITLLYATFITATDIHMLSILFGVLSVWLCLRFERGWILSALSLAMAMALYPSYAELAAVLVLLLMIKDFVLDRKTLTQPREIWKAPAFIILGGIVYYAGWLLAVRLYLGAGVSASPFSGDYNSLNRLGDFRLANLPRLLAGTYTSFLGYMTHPETLQPRIAGFANLAVAAGACILTAISTRKKAGLIPAATLILLLPLGANFAYVLSNGLATSLMVFSFIVLYAGAVMSLEFGLPDDSGKAKRIVWRVTRTVTFLALCFLALNFITFANQTHTKRALEDEATRSVMTRVMDRIEQTEGYVPGQTLVILVGDLNKSDIAQRRGGYDTDSSSFWKQPSFSTTYFESYGVYFRNVLGYPVNLGDRETAIRYSGMSEVVGMPAFPSPGCTRMIGDVLVVKLSDDISLQSTSEKDRTFSDGY